MGYSGNLYLPNHVLFDKIDNKIKRDKSWHKLRQDFIKNHANENTFIIVYGDYNVYFEEKRIKFNGNDIIEYELPHKYVERKNINLNFEQRKSFVKKKFKKTLYDLAKNNKIILLYPSPVSPTRVYDRVLKNKNKISKDKNFYLKDKINYNTSFYKKYNSEVISFLDSIKSDNINKIRLEKTFCPKSKCFLYDNENVYIFDIAHPSYRGSVLINDLILKKIEFLELKKNK